MPEVLVGGHVIARQLKAEGTTCIFTLCGGHIAPIYDGCLREGIDIIDTRHEQAAVHAADGWSRLTRGCGVAPKASRMPKALGRRRSECGA